MAEVESIASPESPAKRPGRAPKEARPDRLPSPPSRTLTIDQLLEYWNRTEQEFRARLLGYLYRLWPFIQRSPGYIDKLSEPPESKDAILHQWGTGEYEIRLTDLDKNAQLCRARFKFSESYVECPPILEPLELDQGRKENLAYIQWLRSKGMLKMPGEAPNNDGSASMLAKALVEMANAKATPRESLESAAVTNAFKIMSEASSRAIETVKNQADPGGVASVIKELKGVIGTPEKGPDVFATIKAVADLMPKPDNTQSTFLLNRITALESSNAELTKRLLDKLSEKPPAPPESEFQKTFMGKVMERALDMLDGNLVGRAGREKWWEIALHHPQVQELAGGLTQAAINLSQAFLISRGGKPGPVVNRQPSAADMLQGLPAGQPSTTPPNANPASAPNEADAVTQTLSNFFNIEKFRSMMFHLNTGLPGQEFAVWCANGGMSLADHAQIKAIGRDKILETIRATPIAWNVIRPIEQQFSKFLDEFLSWTPEWIPDEGPGA